MRHEGTLSFQPRGRRSAVLFSSANEFDIIGSMAGSTKPVTLLKRPTGGSSATPVTGGAVSAGSSSAGASVSGIPHAVPTELVERVTDAVRSAIDGALSRERARMESTYRLRQEKLLRAMADILRGTLQKHVAAAAEREADALANAVRNLAASSSLQISISQEHTDTGANNSTDKKQGSSQQQQQSQQQKYQQEQQQRRGKKAQGDTEEGLKRSSEAETEKQVLENVRNAFRKGFEKELLTAIEAALRDMLSEISASLDLQIESKLVGPTADVANRVLRSAADDVREQKSELNVVLSSASEALSRSMNQRANGDSFDGPENEPAIRKMKDGVGVSSKQSQLSEEVKALEQVTKALSEGRVRDALVAGMNKSAIVKARALNGALESKLPPDEVLGVSESATVGTKTNISGDGGLADVDVNASNALPLSFLTELCALLCSDLRDRTESRLAWLFEAVMSMEDCPRQSFTVNKLSNVRQLEMAIDKLREFSSLASPANQSSLPAAVSTADSKHAKILVRAMKSTVQKLQSAKGVN